MVRDNWIGGTGLTHNVSCTISLREGESTGIRDEIWKARDRISALSFAPFDIDSIFPYAPRQVVRAVDEDLWNQLCSDYKKIDWSRLSEGEDTTSKGIACEGTKCQM
ncbi:MAG: hypothetical protein DRI61_08045 [Chloroflexi bacterium]|nr:MAG: hypothetical protein DRI61_08045 [Chloroflexota bacterium]